MRQLHHVEQCLAAGSSCRANKRRITWHNKLSEELKGHLNYLVAILLVTLTLNLQCKLNPSSPFQLIPDTFVTVIMTQQNKSVKKVRQEPSETTLVVITMPCTNLNSGLWFIHQYVCPSSFSQWSSSPLRKCPVHHKASGSVDHIPALCT